MIIEHPWSIVDIRPDENRVIKRYIRKDYFRCFDREVYWLRTLGPTGFTPEYVNSNRANYEIIMTYRGRKILSSMIPLDWKVQVEQLFEALQNHKCFLKGLFASNIVVQDGRLGIVDLAMCTRSRSEGKQKFIQLIELELAKNEH